MCRWVLIVLLMTGVALAAPLFPQDPKAVDALNLLKSWGVVEGYPEGGFRGERASSRWEIATVVARALARLEGKHAQLLTRAELEELRKLTAALSEELEALGVRTTALEESVNQLDARVGDLEIITFSGRSLTYVGSQSFTNDGNDSSGFGPNALNYHNQVGALAGANYLPFEAPGILPVIDYRRGQPLTNGTGFASLLELQALIQPDADWSAELNLYAYTSQGDSLVDALWGITPPYPSNSFTGTRFQNGQSQNHVPFTNAGLESFVFTYHPAGVTATVGAFEPRFSSQQVYLGQVNAIKRPPAVLPSYGFQVAGDMKPWGWEVFGTRLPNGNPGTTDDPYRSEALGAALTWSQDGWLVGGTFLRASDQFISGGPLRVGQIARAQGGWPGDRYFNWVNPNGFYTNQLGGPNSMSVAGAGSTSDKRPIPGNPGFDGLSRTSFWGPQGITLGGLSVEWGNDDWDLNAEWATSEYAPNRNSAYRVSGDLFNAGVKRRFLDGRIELGLAYRSTDPTYDPMVLSFPDTAANGTNGLPPLRSYHRLPQYDQYWHLYSLHNTKTHPHNRQGLWTEIGWQYRPDGRLQLKYNSLDQVRSSVQDVRFRANALGPGLPNVDVLGLSPGFMDPVFREYSDLSFDAALNPLENQKGSVQSFQASLEQVFTGTPWQLALSYEQWHFDRRSRLNPAFGGSQNLVDLTNSVAHASVGYRFGDDLLLTLGYEQGRIRGHYDPGGLYNQYALSHGSIDFKNRDSIQHVPFARVDWNLDANIALNTEFFYYDTNDKVNRAVFGGAPGGAFATNHPFSWSGYRFGSTLEVTF